LTTSPPLPLTLSFPSTPPISDIPPPPPFLFTASMCWKHAEKILAVVPFLFSFLLSFFVRLRLSSFLVFFFFSPLARKQEAKKTSFLLSSSSPFSDENVGWIPLFLPPRERRSPKRWTCEAAPPSSFSGRFGTQF